MRRAVFVGCGGGVEVGEKVRFSAVLLCLRADLPGGEEEGFQTVEHDEIGGDVRPGL
jgi:hypothetical protein